MIHLDIDPATISTAQQRRWTRTGRTYMPAPVKNTHARYMELLQPYTPHEPVTGPLRVICTVWYKAPTKKQAGAHKQTRPDLDNIWKGLSDCITRAGIWNDDSQVTELHLRKCYCYDGDAPHITVSIRKLEA